MAGGYFWAVLRRWGRYDIIRSGSVAEWLKAHDSKSCGPKGLGGSNPLASAKKAIIKNRSQKGLFFIWGDENLGLVAGFEGGEELFYDGDFAEVVVPHGSVAFAGVGGVAITVRLLAELVEWGLDVGGGEPFFATAGVGERGDGFDVGDPSAAAVVATKEPVVATIVRGETVKGHFADKLGISGEAAEGLGEIGGFVGIDGDELGGAFARIAEAGVGIDRGVGDFLIKVAAELAGV